MPEEDVIIAADGMSSVRFICGLQDIHRELETAIAKHFGPTTILYISCFDANGGVLFPSSRRAGYVIISDEP